MLRCPKCKTPLVASLEVERELTKEQLKMRNSAFFTYLSEY